MFTIHNLAFQGNYPLFLAPALGVPAALIEPGLANPDSIEFYGSLSLMKAGIVHADRVTTVSETYAREILTPRCGRGMEGVLQACADKLRGIINGIDTDTWDPATDALIARRYSEQDARGKHTCKRELQKLFGLPSDPFVPVLALGSRLTGQKMADVAVEAIPLLLDQYPRLQAVVLGQGEAAIERAMVRLAQAYPDRVGVFIGYDEKRAHMLHAGADILLHGSRFEPCGLTQLYAMRYGTIPVASRVRGLADTIVDASVEFAALSGDRTGERARERDAGTAVTRPGTGFLFDGETPRDLATAAGHAIDAFMRPAAWRMLQRDAMQGDFGWDRAVASYLELYAELAEARPLRTPTRLRRQREAVIERKRMSAAQERALAKNRLR